MLVLTAFAEGQRGALSTDSRAHLALDLVGSVVLTVLPPANTSGGFLLLEACRALVAGWGLMQGLERLAFRSSLRLTA